MSGIAAESVWPDKLRARVRFDAVAPQFRQFAFIHDEARARLLGRLDYLRLAPAVILDAGCGRGAALGALHDRFPQARIVGIDSSHGMLAADAPAGPAGRMQADAEQLPFRDGSVDLLFANLVMPWCRPDRVVAEFARVLSADGLLLLSTCGPDTLAELRRAWRQADRGIHVHGFLDMHDIGDLLARAGLAEPVMDVDRLTVTYASLAALIGDLTGTGARNSAAGRMRGLTSRARWSRFAGALESGRSGGRLTVSVELIFAQAWGRGGAASGPRGTGEVEVPVERIGRR